MQTFGDKDAGGCTKGASSKESIYTPRLAEYAHSTLFNAHATLYECPH